MTDPVFANDGHLYEREKIQRCLQSYNTSPVTREVLKRKDLLPNHQLKRQIEAWKAEQRGEAGKQRKVKKLLNKVGCSHSSEEVVRALSKLTEFIVDDNLSEVSVQINRVVVGVRHLS